MMTTGIYLTPMHLLYHAILKPLEINLQVSDQVSETKFTLTRDNIRIQL